MLSLLAVITYLDRVTIAVAGPRMQDALQISPEAWGWVTSVFFLSYSAFEIPTGALGDRIGPRRVLARIVAWWSAFTALTGVVSNYYILLMVRFCFGAGEAGAYPNASVVIGRWIPLANRTRVWGIVWMTSQVGAALSPLLVVPIQMRYRWRAPFFVFGFLGVVWSLTWYVWFRDSPHEKAGVTEAELREIGSAPPVHPNGGSARGGGAAVGASGPYGRTHPRRSSRRIRIGRAASSAKTIWSVGSDTLRPSGNSTNVPGGPFPIIRSVEIRLGSRKIDDGVAKSMSRGMSSTRRQA
jgi:MFS family permease